MSARKPLVPHARWTNDCQGKQDYDGEIITVSTRYWPGPDGGGGSLLVENGPTGFSMSTVPYGDKPKAHSSILLNLGPAEEHDGGGRHLVWADRKFTGGTEAEVKAKVERWASKQMSEIVRRLGGLRAFRRS